IGKAALALAKEEKSAVGVGGMISKLNFARLANQMGIKAVIFSMKTEDGILKAVLGETGTVCQAQVKKLSTRTNWLASGSLITGLVQVDKGALAALSKRKSLLAVGVNKIIQDFEVGEVFQIADEDHVIHAVAKSKIDSVSLRSKAEKKNIEIAHADDIVLL